jgi:hypothetical protein
VKRNRYELIAEYERRFRRWPRSRSTSACYGNYWPHLDMFRHLKYSNAEIARSGKEYAAEQADKATCEKGLPTRSMSLGERYQ